MKNTLDMIKVRLDIEENMEFEVIVVEIIYNETCEKRK